jgi:hypothetical protein
VLGYPSLIKYVEEGLGYSGAQTSERISAMRLLKAVPEVASHLMNGTHSLTSIAKLASHARREGLTPIEASVLVEKTIGHSMIALEKHLLQVSEVEPARIERTKVVSRELTRLTLDVDDEFMARVNRIRELKGNLALSLSEIFEGAMELFIRKKDPAKKNPEGKDPVVRPAEVRPASEVKSAGRYIRANDRRIVRERAGHRCEYVHEKSGKHCDSRTELQMEHVHPYAKGGVNDESNLKLYCAAHNRLRAVQECRQHSVLSPREKSRDGSKSIRNSP